MKTDLYYYRARYYDPTTGRFLTEDPIGFRASINFYSYASNSPVLLNDPTGFDNNADRCRKLAKKIQDIDDDIADRERDLTQDKDKLPYTCLGDIDNPRKSIQGHLRIIRNLQTDRLIALIEYTIRNCGNYTPLPPVPVIVPRRSLRTAPAPAPGLTSATGAVAILLVVALGLAAAL